MKFTITSKGGKDQLSRLRARLQRSPQVLEVVAKNLAEETIGLIREGFAKEREPSGQRWAPLVARSGKILQDTGRLRNGWHRKRLRRTGFTVGPAVTYGRFHQSGTRRIPQRRMVPEGSLPPTWRKSYQRIAQNVLRRYLAG